MSLVTLWAPWELGLREIPGGGRVWCWEGCGSTAGLPAHEKQPHCPEAASGPAGGEGWVPSDDLGLCQPRSLLSPRACLPAGVWPLSWPSPEWRTGTLGVLKILFRKHREFLLPFSFSWNCIPHERVNPSAAGHKVAGGHVPLACCPVVTESFLLGSLRLVLTR